MTVPLILAIVALWVVLAALALVVLTRTVGRADEENAVSSLRRMVRAEDEAQTQPPPPPPTWQPSTDNDGISTRPHS
jgi:type II secretory pathway pseudopilin PulG